MRTCGFKGYRFDANHQPEYTLEWAPEGTGTRYTLFQRGRIGPVLRFTVSQQGQRYDANIEPRTWIEWLYPQYPRVHR
jgi:hypothetical protein